MIILARFNQMSLLSPNEGNVSKRLIKNQDIPIWFVMLLLMRI